MASSGTPKFGEAQNTDSAASGGPDRDERKRQRAERIEKRFVNESKDKNRTKGGSGQDAGERKSRSQQQMADSLAHLDKKKLSGIEEVTAIRTEADFRENRRRIKDDSQAQERLQMLQEEAISSGKLNAAIEMRWAELLELNMPQQLYQEIEAQKKACNDIIASKDSLIREFKKQLKFKDEEYVKALKKYGEDVEDLLKRMRKEVKELQQHYEVEMDAVETAHLMERDELIKSQRGEIEALLDKRRQKELGYMKAKQDREDEYQAEIEDLLVQDAEEYNKLKIKLETEIQVQEQQLEEMRATYQLNTEKLEYNYRVLTERDMENTATLAHQKKKLSKLKDALSSLMAKFHENDTRDRRRNDDLTDEYRRITKQYKDLQTKFRHFEISDNERFEQVWAMHEEEVKAAVDKVLKADDILHKQIFGWEWHAPKLELIYTPEQASSESSQTSTSPETPDLDTTREYGAEDGQERDVVDTAKVKAMLELLATEAGFLVEPKVKDALDKLPVGSAQLAQAESLLRALGISDENDLNVLLTYFVKDDDLIEVEEQDEGTSSQGSHVVGGEGVAPADGQVTAALPLDQLKMLKTIMIKPDDVILAIQRFVEDRKGGHAGPRSPGGTMHSAPGEDRFSRSFAATRKAHRASMSLAAHEKEFWSRLALVLPDQHVQAWEVLEKELQSYTSLLKDRKRSFELIGTLQQENADLKGMLSRYLTDPINEELRVPPAVTFEWGEATAN